MTRVVVLGAAGLAAATIAARLREASVQVIEQDKASQAEDAVFELKRLPDVESIQLNIVEPSQIDGLTYGPQRNRKKGKQARW